MKTTLITITLCIAFLNASIWWSWATFRRTADDVVKISLSQPVNDGADKCIQAGGLPDYYDGKFNGCGRSK